MSAADAAFVRHKSRFAVTWALCNLRRLHEHASAMDAGTPLAGRTAIVVGAGPSLQRNGRELLRAQRKGIAVLAVNSSDGPLRVLGVTPDVLVARESVDLGEDIAASEAALLVLDICAHPAMWDAAGERMAWFIPGYPRHLRICQRLGVRPIFAGTSAMNTAVALAREWGAHRIVLVGTDLALAEDGRAYHPHAARLTDLHARVETMPEGDEALRFTGWGANSELCVRSGQIAQPELQRFHYTMSSDWTALLPTIETWGDQRRWLEIEATRHRKRIDLVNATEGGGGIGGWRLARLRDVVSEEPRRKPLEVPAVYPVREGETALLLADLRREAALLEAVARQMLKPSGPEVERLRDIDGLIFGAPLVEALAAHRIIDAPTGDPLKRCEHVYEAYAEAAAEATKILEVET